MSINGIIGGASNIKTGANPPFTLEDFYLMYPQFGPDDSGNHVVPQAVAQMYLDLADASIKEVRWHSRWRIGMALFTAHFCHLHMQSTADPNSGAAGILEAGQSLGLDTSVSVGDVSVSTDYSVVAESVSGWASWRSTQFGQQLSSLAKLVGKGGMVVL
ncbi:hypothetical protein EUAN_08610 [Andreesenia angusta]|uniref:Bacteriophage protein n=1 Tax=Andreesenia angusta TaxID=39480 RepID=A0A1S1VAC0_9FIRM|nr:DUF4054 domain-containing protein [Andreesenia angusta]OHW63077.1 hypothetical protein EUAN_08610 [Andreesenia angusta]